MEHLDFLHPANAEVLRGPLRYPSESGGWQLGDVDLSKYPSKYRDCEFTLIIAATGEAEERVVCGICGFVLDEVKQCPRCKLTNEETARRIIELLLEQREAMFQEVEEIGDRER